MKDQHEQEAVESKVRRLETEVSTLTTEIQNLKSELYYKQSLLSENYHEGSGMPDSLPGIERKKIEFGINKDFVERLLEYFNGIFLVESSMGKRSFYLETLRRLPDIGETNWSLTLIFGAA